MCISSLDYLLHRRFLTPCLQNYYIYSTFLHVKLDPRPTFSLFQLTSLKLSLVYLSCYDTKLISQLMPYFHCIQLPYSFLSNLYHVI